MFCTSCGSNISDGAAFCPNCGAPQVNSTLFCTHCGAQVTPGNNFCTKCGAVLPFANNAPAAPAINYSPKSKLTAGLLGIFLGGIGVHNFYIGNVGMGIIQIIVSCCTCGIGSIWGFVEGIAILASKEPKDYKGRIMKD